MDFKRMFFVINTKFKRPGISANNVYSRVVSRKDSRSILKLDGNKIDQLLKAERVFKKLEFLFKLYFSCAAAKNVLLLV